MKKLAILFAVIGLALNVAVAENITPVAKKAVHVYKLKEAFLQVTVDKAEKEVVRVRIYDNDFSLLHVETMKKTNVKRFDISQLKAGHYIVKVTADGETVYTEAIEKK